MNKQWTLVVCAVAVLSLLGASVPAVSGGGQSRDAQGYIGYNEMTELLIELENDNPEILSLHALETTWQGRTVWGVKLSDNPDIEEDEPAVLIMGGHHGNEQISVEVPLYILQYIVDNYRYNGSLSKLIEEREIWFIPMVNPDGREASLNGSSHRKNMRDNGDGTFGVDLNRNYGHLWGDTNGSSHNPGAYNYCGPYAFSEPETQAVRDLALDQDFEVSMSFHSYGQIIYYPWNNGDGSPSPREAELTAIADEMSQRNGYSAQEGNMNGAYITNGDSDDWLYANRSCLAYTIELSTVYVPPVDMIDYICLENLEAALYGIWIADDTQRATLPDWTMMIYMGADNDLHDEALDDLNEMESVGPSDDVQIVALFDGSGFGDSKIYEIIEDPNGYDSIINSTIIDDSGSVIPGNGETDMGDPDTLEDFVRWAMDEYPAQRYFLDIWDHGDGIFKGVCKEYSTGGELQLWEMTQALDDLSKDQDWPGIDIFGMDLCRMGHFETAMELFGYADLLIASSDDEPLDGWEYEDVLEIIKTNSNEPIEAMGKQIVDEYALRYPNTFYATLSAIDLRVLETVAYPALMDMARVLKDNMYDFNSTIISARNKAQKFTGIANHPDLHNFSSYIASSEDLPMELRDAAATMQTALELSVLEHYAGSGRQGSNGLGIYLPSSSYSSRYPNLKLSETEWDDFVRMFLEPTRVPVLLTYTLDDEIENPGPYPLIVNVGDDNMTNGSVEIRYSIDGGTYQSIPMVLSGNAYTGSIPEQSDGAIVSYYVAVIDSDGNQITDPYLTNDYGEDHYRFMVLDKYELSITNISIEPSFNLIVGDDILVYANIINSGTNDLYGINVSFFRTDSGPDIFIDSRSIDILEGQNVTIAFPWTAEMTGCLYCGGDLRTKANLTVRIDADDMLNETAEDDNEMTIEAAIDIDSDGDGTGDQFDLDIDGDGLPNAWENWAGLNSFDDSDASLDKDTDGLTAIQEYHAETHPLRFDSDEDGIPDGWEVDHGLDPNNGTDAELDPEDDGFSHMDNYLGYYPPDPIDEPDPNGTGNVPIVPAGSNGNEGYMDDLWMLTLIACIVGAIGGGTVGLLLRKRKNQREHAHGGHEHEGHDHSGHGRDGHDHGGH